MKTERQNRIAAAILLVTTICAPMAESAPIEDPGGTIAEVQRKYEIVGLSVAGLDAGRVVWRTNLGLANISRHIPVSDETKFRIASISKTITATALMQLWEQGRFKLDDDVSDYLGYPVVNPHHTNAPITFRQLLTHKSSFGDGPVYDDFLMLTYRNPLEAPGLRELISEGGEYYSDGAIYSTNVPGTEYSYSNLGFGLLGTLVERMSGKRFDEYCREHIFQPLGMTASFNPADVADGDQLATLYRRGEEGWEAQFDDYGNERPTNRIGAGYQIGNNALPCAPQGGLRASASDLARFMRALVNPEFGEQQGILKRSTIEMMLGQTSGTPNDDTGKPRPLAFHRATKLMPGETWIGHTGTAYGLQSMLFWEEDGTLGVILLTNGSTANEDEVFSDMEKDIFNAVVKRLRAMRSGKQ